MPYSISAYMHTEHMATHRRAPSWPSGLVIQWGVTPCRGSICVRSSPPVTAPSSSARHSLCTYTVSQINSSTRTMYNCLALVCCLANIILVFVIIDVLCPIPRPPSHGRLVTMGTIPGSCLHYECDRGHTLIGSNDRVCLTNSSWTRDTPLCCE